LDWDERACVCVVCASGGYPGDYEKGKEIFGLDEAAKINDVVVFHAGTKSSLVARRSSLVKYFTNGGRVLGVTGRGDTIKQAIAKTYQAVEKIHFEGMHYRRDIGSRAMTNDKIQNPK
jgi:phosphoribosylamine--glycine ligase